MSRAVSPRMPKQGEHPDGGIRVAGLRRGYTFCTTSRGCTCRVLLGFQHDGESIQPLARRPETNSREETQVGADEHGISVRCGKTGDKECAPAGRSLTPSYSHLLRSAGTLTGRRPRRNRGGNCRTNDRGRESGSKSVLTSHKELSNSVSPRYRGSTCRFP